MKKILSLLVAALFATTVYAGEYPDISIKDLQAAIKAGKVAVIDVNGAGSYKKGHIPTAIHFSSKGKDLGKLLPKDKKTWSWHTVEALVAVPTSEEHPLPKS